MDFSLTGQRGERASILTCSFATEQKTHSNQVSSGQWTMAVYKSHTDVTGDSWGQTWTISLSKLQQYGILRIWGSGCLKLWRLFWDLQLFPQFRQLKWTYQSYILHTLWSLWMWNIFGRSRELLDEEKTFGTIYFFYVNEIFWDSSTEFSPISHWHNMISGATRIVYLYLCHFL